MGFPRPLTKTLTKKMCLKTLYEMERPGGRLSGKSHYYRAVAIDHMPTLFVLGELDRKEKTLALQAMLELQRDGYITQIPQIQAEFIYCLTDEGMKLAEQTLDDMQLLSISLQELLSRESLLSKVRDDFYSGEYESAVMNAFKMVEEAVRAKSGQATAYGSDLVKAAFLPTNAILKHPDAQSQAEVESLFSLFRGAFGWFRNPASHRTVGYADARQAAHILAFANLLLDMIDQCRV